MRTNDTIRRMYAGLKRDDLALKDSWELKTEESEYFKQYALWELGKNGVIEVELREYGKPFYSPLKYDMGMNYNDIAAIEGVTMERIRQIEAKALKKLRESGKCRFLRSFL